MRTPTRVLAATAFGLLAGGGLAITVGAEDAEPGDGGPASDQMHTDVSCPMGQEMDDDMTGMGVGIHDMAGMGAMHDMAAMGAMHDMAAMGAMHDMTTMGEMSDISTMRAMHDAIDPAVMDAMHAEMVELLPPELRDQANAMHQDMAGPMSGDPYTDDHDSHHPNGS